MGCGCGGASAQAKYKVTSGGTTKTFDSKAEAEAFAIKNGGGIVTRA